MREATKQKTEANYRAKPAPPVVSVYRADSKPRSNASTMAKAWSFY